MKKILLFALTVLIAILVYYSIETVIAYRATPEIKKEFISDSKINLRFDELNEDEFISLMAMPVSPKYYNILTHPENNQKRSQRIKEMLYGRYEPKGLFDIYYNK
jgi:membrane peptidoglycan carboxypeptidase